ncbi:hypothetical protein Tco_1329803 [Tanacetum coccineum]
MTATSLTPWQSQGVLLVDWTWIVIKGQYHKDKRGGLEWKAKMNHHWLEDFVPKSRRGRRLWICEQVRVFALELVLTFSRVFWTSTCIPTDFNDRYTASLKLLDLTVHYLYGFINEVEFVVELDFL